jgi:cell wall-associated NlpC family hydrolase
MRAALVIAGAALLLAACSIMRPTEPQAPAPPVGQYSTPAPPTPRAIFVDSAKAMLGQPYRYGGAAPGGFDCSGLVAYAAGRAGIRVPRTAQEQLRVGSVVRRTDVRAGDLVFMRLSHKELHVGIALDAERFVHAPATGRVVRIDSLRSRPYAHAFLSARRILDPSMG